MGTLIFLENLAGGTLIRVGSLIRHCIVDGLENRPYSWGSFTRDPGPEFPGNGNAKNPGFPGNCPSRDSRPTALAPRDCP